MLGEAGYFWLDRPQWANRVMLIDENGKQVTYGEKSEFVNTVGQLVKPRTLMFILCENSVGSVLYYLMALCKNVVPLLLNVRIQSALLKSLIEAYQPEYVAMPQNCQSEFVTTAQNCQPEHMVMSENCRQECVAVLEDDNTTCIKLAHKYGYVLYKMRNDLGSPKMYDELALLLSTSGSTGSPKMVRQSYKNISSNAAAIAGYLELSSSERPIATLPMHYTYGLSVINSHLLVGATILMTKRSVVEKEFWTFFQNECATSISGVPYTYKILRQLRFEQMRLPSLRTMTQAGGKLPANLQFEFADYAQKYGKKWIVMYGQTEATARMSYLPQPYAAEKIESIGIAIPGGRFHLINENNEDIMESNVMGELVYEGKNVTLGYALKRADLVKGDEWGGVLYTGDMARRDEEGFYYIVGRKKRFLKIFGNRVNLDEIEQKLNKTFPSLEFACAGEDDFMQIYVKNNDSFRSNHSECENSANVNPGNVNRGNMNLEKADLEKYYSDSIYRWLSRNINLNCKGYCLYYVNTIPRNESGKILYSQLSYLIK